jgi:hypothetical protein
MLDVNGQSIGDGTLELVKFAETASAVNEITVTNSATGNAPEIASSGDDTNIDLKLTPKGTGKLNLDGIKFPNADGSAGQALTTNGSGILSFSTISADGTADWDTTVKTANFTATANKGYFCNTTSAEFTVTLPATPSAGDEVIIVDYAATFATNNLIITSTAKINGSDNDVKLTTNREGTRLVYIDSTQGYIAYSGVNEGTAPSLTNVPPTYSINYLVVAGGGAGGGSGGGGGGAGGLLTSTATFTEGEVYTITVGGGGASGGTGSGSNGADSSLSGTGISTVTSIGGGGGGKGTSPSNVAGFSGGSGGGGGGYDGSNSRAGGAGTSGQGNAGGNATNAGGYYGAGGGGGAGSVGGNGTGSAGGTGGTGSSSSITGSSVTYSTGGTGSGSSGSAGSAGTANTGNGGNGGTLGSNGGAGGSGVVILSMPDASYSGTTTGSPTVATGVSGKTVLTFTGSGSYTA